MTITVPKSCRHPGLSIEEVEAYYSLTPLSQSSVSPGYDYDKTISDILNIYLSTKQHPSASAKGVKKFRLKQACLADEPAQKKSRVFRDFNCWRLAQISRYCDNEDLGYDDTAYLKEKLAKAELKIRQLKTENKSLKLRLIASPPPASPAVAVEKKEDKETMTQAMVKKNANVVVVEKVEEPDCKAVLEKVEFKITQYYKYDEDYDTDEERIRHYYSRCQEAQEMCERMYNNNYNCLEGKKGKNSNTIVETYTDWCDEELEELTSVIDDPGDEFRRELEDRHYKMLKTSLWRMTKKDIN